MGTRVRKYLHVGCDSTAGVQSVCLSVLSGIQPSEYINTSSSSYVAFWRLHLNVCPSWDLNSLKEYLLHGQLKPNTTSPFSQSSQYPSLKLPWKHIPAQTSSYFHIPLPRTSVAVFASIPPGVSAPVFGFASQLPTRIL